MTGAGPPVVQWDADCAFSPRYGDVYASRDGALGQARHVFLAGNGLAQRWAGREQFVIVETGFGLGVNFLATWQAWRADPARPARLHVVSVERHPVTASDLLRAAAEPLREEAAELVRQWPLPLPGLHRLRFDGGRVTLTLAFGAAEALVPRLAVGADAFYLDGFAPDRNPDMWSAPLLKALAALARPGATLATWCVARPVREALVAAGFEIERRPGFGRKRDMLVARFAPRWRVRRHDPPPPRRAPRTALVVGAGLAGCAAAAALAARGWEVEVLEARGAVAGGASALPWGLLHPQVAADDNVLARLTRAGTLLALPALRSAEGAAPGLWSPCGVLRVARDDGEAGRLREALRALAFPHGYVRWVEDAEASRRAGLPVARGGLWFEGAGAVAAPRWCEAMLAGAPGIRLRDSTAVASLVREGDGWRALDASGRTRAAAAAVVVATALEAPALLGLRCAPVRAVRGRVSRLRADDLAALRVGLAGDGTVVRAPDGFVGVGASYENDDAVDGAAACSGRQQRGAPGELPDLHAIHRGNLLRLRRLLAADVEVQPAGVFDGVRCVARDRLPLVGRVADEDAARAQVNALRGAHLADLPRLPDLYAAFAFGSRGLALAPLAGELIAAQAEGEPWPIERPLAGAIDAGRFLLRRLRTGA